MGKRRKRSRILVVGNFTFDVIDGKRFPGGPPLYAGLGVVAAGGVPILWGKFGPDYPLQVLDFPHELIGLRGGNTTTFRVLFENGRRIMSVLENSGKIGWPPSLDVDGVLVDPVCSEVDSNLLDGVNVPMAVDVQGFIRKICGTSPLPSQGMVLHANYDEFSSLDTNLQELSRGNREILLSFDSDGFLLISGSKTQFYRSDMRGERTVGNGDFLLASYFTLRVSGYGPWEAAQESKWLVESFSNSLPI
jgi:hypothetical protein